MPLQKFVGNVYSVFMEILLWVIPIIGIISGIAFFSMAGGNTFVGFLLGLLAGLLLDVICFGPIILLMNMRASLKNIENK